VQLVYRDPETPEILCPRVRSEQDRHRRLEAALIQMIVGRGEKALGAASSRP
jgi:hypothetical protein